MLQSAGLREIERVLRSAVVNGVTPGVVVAVTDRDTTIYSGAFGLQDLASGVPMAPQTIFRIASMTKVLTSLAVMMLCEEGAIRLDDTVIGDGLTRADQVIGTSHHPTSADAYRRACVRVHKLSNTETSRGSRRRTAGCSAAV
jgi:hypothetical protein